MKLYSFWRSSASWRVRIALHFKGIAFTYQAVNLTAGEQNEPAHRARNPIGSVPVLETTEGKKTVWLSQSMAIFEYLEETTPAPALFPVERAARTQVRMLCEVINSAIQPLHNLNVVQHLKNALHVDERAFARHFTERGLNQLETLAAGQSGKFLVGDSLTAADMFLIPQLYGARRWECDLSLCPTLLRVEKVCAELPAFISARPEVQPDAQPV